MKWGSMPRGGKRAGNSTILVSANTFWNIANFRDGLTRALAAAGYRVAIASPDPDPAWASLRGASVAEIAVDRSGLNPFRDAKLFFTYINLFGLLDPEFYFGFTVKPNIFGCLAARVRSVHAIPNVSGLGTAFINPGPLSALVGMLYRIAFARCPIIFFQNQDDLDLFVARKIVRFSQARLLPGSGIDLRHFAPTSPPSGVTYLFIGRLLGDKGVREFVEAARLLRPNHPDWKFQLLGPFDEGNRSGIGPVEVDQWIKEGVVDYLGQANDVRPFLAASTAVVLPSYREGLPRTLLEAAAMAKPLIATDVPGNRRIVEHGVNGVLCAARDPHSLAQAMLEVGAMDAGKRDAMGRAGRAIAERSYDEQQVIGAYLEAIAQLRGGRRS